jgi:transcriptional regulator with PAS, ATPase and Fis domain
MEDLETLVRHFIKKVSIQTGKRIAMIQEDVIETFHHYHWQGNIRELENIIEAAIHLAKSDVITLEAIPDYIKTPTVFHPHDASLKDMLHEAEKNILFTTIKKYDGDKRKAAKALGISKSSMYEKIQKYELD